MVGKYAISKATRINPINASEKDRTVTKGFSEVANPSVSKMSRYIECLQTSPLRQVTNTWQSIQPE